MIYTVNMSENKIVHKDEANLPTLNVGVPAEVESKPLISDEQLVNYYEEAIGNIRDDRKEAHDMYMNFAEMVLNEGDPSSASKEALVSLLKLKFEGNDKMIKILDLWTRMKMKEKDTMPRWLAVQQNNKIENKGSSNINVRRMLKMFDEQEPSDNEQ